MVNPDNDIINIMRLYQVLLCILIGIGICGFVLFVKLARRGIKALDIYIRKNSKDLSDK